MSTPLSKRTLASHSGIWMPLAAMTMPIAVYLPPFYGETLGLSLTTVGIIFTLARVWDTITDPIMGVLIDRVDTRWGRRKPWVAVSLPILMLAAYMLYLPDPETASGAYLGIWLFVLYIGYTMIGIAHQSWGAELAPTYDERSRLFGWREMFVMVGMTTVLAIPAGVDLFGDGDFGDMVGAMGWYIVVLIPIMALPLLMFVPDSNTKTGTSISIKEALSVLIGNRLLRRVLITDLLTGFALAASGALYIFMAAYIFELGSHASFALLLFFLSGTLAMPLWMKLAYRIGKTAAIKVSIVYGVVIEVGVYLLAEPGNAVLLWGYTLAFGIAFGAAPALLRSMLADITDLDELESGNKRTAMYYSLLLTTSKLAAALSVGITLPLVELGFGFQPGENNTEAALDGLLFTYAIVPAIALAVAYLPMIGYPLGREEVTRVQNELRQRELA